MAYFSTHHTFAGIPLGFAVRKQLANTWIFRVRRGNGFWGSIAGKKYQDRYTYVVPGSINNPQGQTAREALATAVYNWKNVLTEDQKKAYNARALGKHMSGYNLYIKDYVKENA